MERGETEKEKIRLVRNIDSDKSQKSEDLTADSQVTQVEGNKKTNRLERKMQD